MSSSAITAYQNCGAYLEKLRVRLTPWFRVILKLLALPYWFIYKVDRSVCRIGNWQILKDFYYIVFVLRYFPDNYYPTRLWEKDRSEWAYYYGSILNPFQRAALLREICPIDYHILAKDKEVNWKICEALALPHAETFGILDPAEDFKGEITRLMEQNSHSSLVIKPVLGSGGDGIKLVSYKDGEIQVRDFEQVYPLSQLTINLRYMVQPYIVQHESLNTFSPYSVNTIRAITIFDKSKGKSFLLGTKLRSSGSKSYTDNMHSGGISVGIDSDTGQLFDFAINSEAKTYANHPMTDVIISGFQLPFWEDVRKLALKTQDRFNKLQLLGLDIAITKNGPCIIELNHQPCMMGFEQAAGPILKNRETWEFFKKHNLLINPSSRNLFPS